MNAEENKRTLSTNFQHDSISIGAASSMTFNMGSGTDTSTNRYLNLPGGWSYGLDLVPTVACTITKINGLTLKAAISVPINGYHADYGRFQSITITASGATVVEIGGKC